MPSQAATVDTYLAELPDDRRAAVQALLDTFDRHLPKGYERRMNYGMPAYVVPHSLYPAGYHCEPALPLPFLSVAAQKSAVSVYHMGLYADPALLDWFTAAHAKASAKKLDMGKSCIRYKKAEDIPLPLLGQLAAKVTPKAWIALYESALKPKKG
jgi:hypothetical protein